MLNVYAVGAEHGAEQPSDSKALVASGTAPNPQAIIGVVNEDALKEKDGEVYASGEKGQLLSQATILQ
jgi:hypothetical protein